MSGSYSVYILASRRRTLYTGITNDLERRIWEHRNGTASSFTRRYRIYRLVWVEHFDDVHEAIAAEKRIKGWVRVKKIRLIEAQNPNWNDLLPAGRLSR